MRCLHCVCCKQSLQLTCRNSFLLLNIAALSGARLNSGATGFCFTSEDMACLNWGPISLRTSWRSQWTLVTQSRGCPCHLLRCPSVLLDGTCKEPCGLHVRSALRWARMETMEAFPIGSEGCHLPTPSQRLSQPCAPAASQEQCWPCQPAHTPCRGHTSAWRKNFKMYASNELGLVPEWAACNTASA